MKSNTAVLVALFVAVAVLLFVGVFSLLRFESDSVRTGAGATSTGTPDKEPGRRVPKTDNSRTRKPGRTPSRTRTIHVTGTVHDVDDNGVPGASVTLMKPVTIRPDVETADWERIKVVNQLFDLDVEEYDLPREMATFARPPTASAPGKEASVIVAGQTKEDGSFDLAVPLGHGTGPFRLVAKKDGIGTATANGVRTTSPTDLVLGQSGAVEGIVLSGAESHPVGRAWVRLDDGERQWDTRADDDGKFKIEGIAPGHYDLRAGAEGHPPVTSRLVQVSRTKLLEVRLPRGTRLRVRAVTGDRADVPVQGAEIVLLEETTFGYETGTTDGDGWAEFPRLPAGSYLINGVAQDLAPFSDEQVVLDGESMVEEATVEFEETVETPITVVNDNGMPIPGVEFHTANWDDEYDSARSMKLPGASDAAGKYAFRFEFMGPRSSLFAVKKGYGMAFILPEDETEAVPIRVVLSKGIRVHGAVRTAAGEPVADAVVEFEVIPEDEFADDDLLFQIRTGADGRYDFPYVPRGEIWVTASTDVDFADDHEIELEDGKNDYTVDMVVEIDDE